MMTCGHMHVTSSLTCSRIEPCIVPCKRDNQGISSVLELEDLPKGHARGRVSRSSFTPKGVIYLLYSVKWSMSRWRTVGSARQTGARISNRLKQWNQVGSSEDIKSAEGYQPLLHEAA